ENFEQVSVPAPEVLKHLAQLLRGRFGIEPKHPANDMIGTDLVGRVEVPGLSRWLEGPYDDPRRIRAKIEALAIHKFGGGQRCSLVAIGLIPHRRRWRIIFSTHVSRGFPLSWPSPRTAASPQDREDTIAPILHPCSHWRGPDAGHPNNSRGRDRQATSARRISPATSQMSGVSRTA